MAGSTSLDDGNSGAPTDFQISSSSDSSDCGQYEIRSMYEREKCPLCLKLKKRFICKECLGRGDFWSSSRDIRERFPFNELKTQLQEKKIEREQTVGQCLVLTEPRNRVLVIIEEMEKYERMIQIQKQLKQEVEKRVSQAKQECEYIKKQVSEKERIWPLYRSRLNNMEQQRAKRMLELKKKANYVLERRKHLQNVSKSRILQLKEYIFPLHEVYADPVEGRVLNEKLQASNVTLLISSNDSWSDEEDDTVRSLMAAHGQGQSLATASSNRGGARVGDVVTTLTDLTKNTFGLCHHSIASILGPSLPVSGDYSAYNSWTEGSGGQTGTSQNPRNPAHVISAGLTFLTQFVNMISYYLDLRLPHRLSYSEFSIGCPQNGKFNRKVAKLNANVIHLCASQGIPPNLLQPRKTIANLLLLFDESGFCDLGRRGPFEVAIQLAKSMEESIERDLVIFEDDESETDWNDWNFPSDWETVHRGAITEEMAQLQNMTKQSYIQTPMDSDSFIRSSRNTTTSTISGLVTSFFRGWK